MRKRLPKSRVSRTTSFTVGGAEGYMTSGAHDDGELGEIVGTEGTEEHPVMVIRKDEQEILIPMVDDMITGIDFETGKLVVRTPPGWWTSIGAFDVHRRLECRTTISASSSSSFGRTVVL